MKEKEVEFFKKIKVCKVQLDYKPFMQNEFCDNATIRQIYNYLFCYMGEPGLTDLCILSSCFELNQVVGDFTIKGFNSFDPLKINALAFFDYSNGETGDLIEILYFDCDDEHLKWSENVYMNFC